MGDLVLSEGVQSSTNEGDSSLEGPLRGTFFFPTGQVGQLGKNLLHNVRQTNAATAKCEPVPALRAELPLQGCRCCQLAALPPSSSDQQRPAAASLHGSSVLCASQG